MEELKERKRKRTCNIPFGRNNVADIDDFDGYLDDNYTLKEKKHGDNICAANIVFTVVLKENIFSYENIPELSLKIIIPFDFKEIIPGNCYKFCLPYETTDTTMKVPNFKINSTLIKCAEGKSINDYKIIIRFRPSESIVHKSPNLQKKYPIRIITTIFDHDSEIIERWISSDFISIAKITVRGNDNLNNIIEGKKNCLILKNWEKSIKNQIYKHPATYDNEQLYKKDMTKLVQVNNNYLEDKGLIVGYEGTRRINDEIPTSLHIWTRNEYIQLFETQGNPITRRNFFFHYKFR